MHPLVAQNPMQVNLFSAASKQDMCFLKAPSKSRTIPVRFRQENPPFYFQSLSRPKATGKNPLRRFIERPGSTTRIRLGTPFMLFIGLLFGTCGGFTGQIWPFGDIFRAKGILWSQDRTGTTSEVFLKYPGFTEFQGEATPFPLSPGTLRGYGNRGALRGTPCLRI